jgi:hypothetical protein
MLIGRFPIEGEPDILAMLERLLQENLRQMRESSYPSVYDLGTFYRREPIGREKWTTARYMRTNPAEGFDCEDLASYQVAFLRTTGLDPRAKTGLKRSVVGWHVVVIRGDGRIEDPSKTLGM